MKKWLVLAGVLAMLCGKAGKDSIAGTNPEHGTKNYWRDIKFIPDPGDSTGRKGRWTGWFHQDNVDVSGLARGEIRARVEGRWQSFKIVELPLDFCQWNFGRRLKQLGTMMEKMERGEMPDLSGPHNGMVASHGARRRDSDFSINCAVKGMGWLPRPEKLTELIELLKATWDDTITRKLAVLESLYRNGSQIFDLTKQTSLELYAQPNFETHTFLNQMADPGVAIVFLDLPKSYELRCIAQMLHPDDQNLSEYEKQVVEYINLIHDYFHGQSPRKSIAVIYHVLQVFDNSPGRWRGQRIAPAMER